MAKKRPKYNKSVSEPANTQPAKTEEYLKLTKEELFELFAKQLSTLSIKNPNRNTKPAKRYQKLKREDIVKWLQSPSQNEKSLRNASIYMYLNDMRYYRLIHYYADIVVWAYVISPLNFDPEKYAKNPANYQKQFYKISHLLENMNVAESMRRQVVVALREGAFYGVRWLDSTSSFIQQLDADYCTIDRIVDDTFLFSYDMSSITDEAELANFPPEFTDMYVEYAKTGEKFQPVPEKISVCIKADPTVISTTLPTFAAVLPEIYRVADAADYDDATNELNNYKLLACKVPIDNLGQPKMDWPLVKKYTTELAQSVGDRVGVVVTPFDTQDFSFEQSASAAEVDALSKTVKNYWSSAGTSALLHGETTSTSGVLKQSIKNDEAFAFELMKQCEKVLNRYLKLNVTGTFKFKVTFLPMTIFNREEYISKLKEGLNYGMGKSYYMAAIGIPQGDVSGLVNIENDVLKLNDALQPLKTSSTLGTDDSENKAGGVTKSDEDLTDSGEATRDNDSNDNR